MSQVSRYDQASIPLFNQSFQEADSASARQRRYLESLVGSRSANLRDALDRQTQAMQGYGDVVSRRYNSAQGQVGQSLASRGLYNSTIAPGMSALVERERSAALGQARQRQASMMGSLFGQQAQLMDAADAQRISQLANIGANDYRLRTLLPTSIANNRVTSTQAIRKGGKGILGKLFR